MLTKKELQWLDNRGKFSCWYCPDIPQAMCTMGERPAHCAIMDTDWKEAAEFSERVAAKLAGILDCTLRSRDYTLYADCVRVCPAATDCTKNNQLGLDCAPYLLKWARLAVEEEMDADLDK